DEAAAAWEASLAAEGDKPADAAAGEAGGEPQRVLNQDEIDTLLGFDVKKDGGGQRSEGIFAILDKSMTAYEKLPMLEVVFKRMVDVVLADMSSAFEPLSPATFHFERLETNPRFATITRPGNPALLVKFRVDMVEDRGGMIEVLLPHTTLEPIRDLLLQMFMG